MTLGLKFGMKPKLAKINPILTISNVINYTQFWDASKLTLSGSNITAIANTLGTKSLTGTGAFQRDATLFNNKGGVKVTSQSDLLTYNSTFSADTSQTFGVVLWVPTYAADGGFLNFNASSSCWIYHDAAGLVRYYRNQAAGTVDLYNATDLAPLRLIVRLNDNSNMDIFVNDTASPIQFDPNDALGTATNVRFGLRSSNDITLGAGFGEYFHTTDVLANSDIAAIMAYWKSIFSA